MRPDAVVFGAGAIGCLLAARLSENGIRTVLFARGTTLARIRDRGGVRLRDVKGERWVALEATDDANELAGVPLLFLTIKEPGLQAALPSLDRMLSSESVIVPVMNGLLWWFFAEHASPQSDEWRALLDPGAAVALVLPPDRVVAAVPYLFARSDEPGAVDHAMGNRLIVGASSSGGGVIAAEVADLLRSARFSVEESTNIRADVWSKAVANAIINPLSVLAESKCGPLARDAETQLLMEAIFGELDELAGRLGIENPGSFTGLVKGYRRIGKFKTSMLQDWERGEPLELEALVGRFTFLAHALDVPARCLRGVHGLVRLKEAPGLENPDVSSGGSRKGSTR